MLVSTRASSSAILVCLSLLVTSSPLAGAEDDRSRACLAEVRQEMGRFKVKGLDPKVQHTVAQYCARGDLDGALRLAVPAAAVERCALRVREVAAAEPVASREDLSRAVQLCRRGDQEGALALVGGDAAAEAPAVEKAPGSSDPVLPTAPPAPSAPATPAGPPNIFRFQATPSVVRAGEPARLLWDVYRSDAVTLDGETVAARGERVVRPRRTTRYTLAATSSVDRVDERLTVAVSPYPPATLGASIARIEVCRELGSEAGNYRCLAPDGPFYAGDPVQVILHFEALPAGSHRLEYELFAGSLTHPAQWTRIDHAEGAFTVEKDAAPRKGTGRRPERSRVRDHRAAGVTPTPPASPTPGPPPLRMAAGGAPRPSSDPVVAPPPPPAQPSGEDASSSPAGPSTAFALTDRGKGPRKLVVIVDGNAATRSEILYCVECPGHDEW